MIQNFALIHSISDLLPNLEEFYCIDKILVTFVKTH